MSRTQNLVALPAVTVLGAGTMGGAVLAGVFAPHVVVDGPVRVTVRTTAGLARYPEARIAATALEDDPGANRAAVVGAKIVVLAVKPALIAGVLAEIAGALDEDAVVVSVAAGITLEALAAAAGASVAVARAMPNTPALVGHGVTGLCFGDAADERQRGWLRALFGTVGAVVEVGEAQMDALTSVSGSGPAYVFYLIERLTEAAVRKGFAPDQARLMVQGTFLGAALLLADSGEQPSELRRRVTSPKGTTEAAVAVLEAAHLDELFDRVTDAALARARQLASGS